MRQFTEAEKRQLQIKIDDQERKHQIVREIVKKGTEAEITDPIGTVWKYGYLAIILCLLGFNVIFYFYTRHSSYPQSVILLNLVVALMLLLNHIAFHFTKTGRSSLVMKSVACTMTVSGLAYAAYVYWLTVLAI